MNWAGDEKWERREEGGIQQAVDLCDTYLTMSGREEEREWEGKGKGSNCKATPTGIICLHNIGYWIGSKPKEMGISMKFVRHNTHSRQERKEKVRQEERQRWKKRISPRKFMQATNSKHMSFCVFQRTGSGKGKGQGQKYVEPINCLFTVCNLFVFLLSARNWCHCADEKETTQKSNPVTVTIVTIASQSLLPP